MKLAQILFSQGFGARRECIGRVLDGQVAIDGVVHDDPDEDLDPEGLVLHIQGRAWPYHAKALVMLHKPPGYECSMKPKHHPSVMSLLPLPLRVRGLQPVGRLDEDTTGLLLLTDDGALIHKLTSPKHHVPKVYDVRCKHPVSDEHLRQLLDGVVLDDDPQPVRAEAVERVDPHRVRLTLVQGKYHQVKRMLAAVSNRVEQLHRSQFGPLVLPADLAPGQWCWLDAGMSWASPEASR
jgi:16S rRNA pseudouridine516 synthase